MFNWTTKKKLKTELEALKKQLHTRAVTGEPYIIPNYIVMAWTPLGFFGSYYVPQARNEEHAIDQVREWFYRVAGIKTPWCKEYGPEQLKITQFKAKKLDNSQIHVV